MTADSRRSKMDSALRLLQVQQLNFKYSASTNMQSTETCKTCWIYWTVDLSQLDVRQKSNGLRNAGELMESYNLAFHKSDSV